MPTSLLGDFHDIADSCYRQWIKIDRNNQMEHGARLKYTAELCHQLYCHGVVILGNITTNVIQAVSNYRLPE